MRAPSAIELLHLAMRRRVSTVDWPRQRLEVEGPQRGVPVVDMGACTACGACTSACPTGAIRMVEGPAGGGEPVVDAGPCVRCGLCEAACGEGAVSLEGPRDVVVLSREGMVMDGTPQPEVEVVRSPSRLYRVAVEPSEARPVHPLEVLVDRSRSLGLEASDEGVLGPPRTPRRP